MSTSGSRDQSRRSSRSSATIKESSSSHKSSGDRRVKARSTQIEPARRRPSEQDGVAAATAGITVSSERPMLKSRTNSAPLVQTLREERRDENKVLLETTDGFEAQDEDEVAGVVGAVKQYRPFHNPELSNALPDINLAVLGSRHVGKSTFMQRALDLQFPSDSRAVERKIGVDGTDYLLRLLEFSIDDVEIDDDGTIDWPESIEDKIMPQIDGVVTLYDVTDRRSLEDVIAILRAIEQVEIPSLLASAKCDAPISEREIDPRAVERQARREITGIETIQLSANKPDSDRQCISMLLRAIAVGLPEITRRPSSSASRMRAQSSIVRPASPRAPSERGHMRSASEYTGSLYKESRHARHESTPSMYSAASKLYPPRELSEDDAQASFFFEESASEASSVASQTDDEPTPTERELRSNSFSSEEGVAFPDLVDRLLSQPTSKADDKFAAVFLALYRKFAAPGELLEAIVQRFGRLEEDVSACMIKTADQLRALVVLQQWTSTYPGDFAYPKTKRRMRTFIGKLADCRIFAAAAKEMWNDLDATKVDDDTNWAYCDKDRKSVGSDIRISMTSTTSTLIDDPDFLDGLSMRQTWASEDSTVVDGDTIRSSSSSSQSSQIATNIELAQQQATLLQPIPRQPVTKIQWRLLMECTDDAVARELTRMDWIMFCSIRPRDLVRQVSLSKTLKAGCKNVAHVNRMIEHFNHLAFWVSNYILLRDKAKHRALMLEKFMRVARKLRELNNYNALGAIIAGIKSSSVHSLAATRELIPPSVGKDWLKLEILMSPSKSYAAYRLAWENSSAERIPYLPLHRRDLASAEEGNRTFVGDEADGRINWRKFEIMGEVVVGMQKAQGTPYKGLGGGGRGNEQIKELVLDVRLVKDEDELFARSKQIEPTGTPAIGTTAKFREMFMKR